MTQPTRVSVVIPLFNKAAYVADAISSVIAQGAGVGEIVVVDDGSTDAGPSLVADVAKSDSRIRLLSQNNSGVSSARNAGIRAAREELVTFLDADDWYLPGYVESALKLAHLHKNAAMVCSGYVAVFPNGISQTRVLKPASSQSWSGEVTDFYREWSKASFTCTNAIALRRETLLRREIWFPEDECLGEDQDVWFRAAESGPVVYRNAPLVAYRMDVIGSATYGKSPMDILPCYQRLFERLSRREIPSHMTHSASRLVASHILNVANARLCAGNAGGAWELLSDPRARSSPAYFARSLYRYVCARFVRGANTT